MPLSYYGLHGQSSVIGYVLIWFPEAPCGLSEGEAFESTITWPHFIRGASPVHASAVLSVRFLTSYLQYDV